MVSTNKPLTHALAAVVLLGASLSLNSEAAEGVSIFDPSAAEFQFLNELKSGPADRVVQYGPVSANRIPVFGDWTGDGVDTLGVYDPAAGVFELRNANTSGNPDRRFRFGPSHGSTLPLAGDWNGDGVDTVAVYDLARGEFHLADVNFQTAGYQTFRFGPVGVTWYPVAGDWDGDGLDTVGLYDPDTAVFNLRDSNTSGDADRTIRLGRRGGGYLPVAGDWTASGRDSIGVYRPARGRFELRKTLDRLSFKIFFSVRGNTPQNVWPAAGNWKAEEASQVDIRLNAGGPDLLDSKAQLWVGDDYLRTGERFEAASGTQPLYRAARQPKAGSASLEYAFTVPNGHYQVSLHFGEFDPAGMGTGARVFDVAIQAKRVLRNLDVFAEVGAYQPLVKTQTADVTDRKLVVRLDRVVGEPRIAAIRIRENGNPSDLSGGPADDDGSSGNSAPGDAGGDGSPNAGSSSPDGDTGTPSTEPDNTSGGGSTSGGDDSSPNNGSSSTDPGSDSTDDRGSPSTEPGNTSGAGSASGNDAGSTDIDGDLKKWHRITLTFDGPSSSEEATPNPFSDYRLLVTFTNGSKTHIVPGYYACDGNAAETSASSGNKWRVHFVPDETGTWKYSVSFRAGPEVAVSLAPGAGSPTLFDGASGSFSVAPTDKSGNDFRGKGMLRYVGEHYLRFAETGEYFIKQGPGDPEQFLSYADFDNTPRARYTFGPHVGDWRSGDPTWQGGKGKGIIGSLNYLSSKGMNTLYFMVFNDGGNWGDVWPHTAERERHRYDCSKLDQWEIVFSHMDKVGIQLHLFEHDHNNDQLDNGTLGPQRKLFYRELIARYAHHLGVLWTLAEEVPFSDQQTKDFAKRHHDLDPYDHPVATHTFSENFDGLLSYPYVDAANLEYGSHNSTDALVTKSAAAGHRWIVSNDEQTTLRANADAFARRRKRDIWPILMAGGNGSEQYLGNRLVNETFRDWDEFWDMARHAKEFFERLPVTQMQSHDELMGFAQGDCFAQPGEIYVVYADKKADQQILDLQGHADTFNVWWYNPRTGGSLQGGTVATVSGPGEVSLGSPPSEAGEDWAILITRQGKPLQPGDTSPP